MDCKEGDDSSSAGSGSSQKPQTSRLSCTKYFDALWFCYSPFHQMEQYYRYGHFDSCSGKWSSLFDCLSLKTKRPDEVEFAKFQSKLSEDFTFLFARSYRT
ncbi:uncharacterized protein C227.17c isoform X4 [Dendrobium catenatum]|uniref:uncharacterized protein C227.17c isoform X4 n=1 Tax=Dendrobium catenatum TaxID=906689 RepID=UPI0009F469D6|nr:uncharacterized protein C227.17c isoform X4 [Dendrobium catenatum]